MNIFLKMNKLMTLFTQHISLYCMNGSWGPNIPAFRGWIYRSDFVDLRLASYVSGRAKKWWITRWKTHLMDLRRSCQHCYNHVWTRLDKYGPVWMSLDQSGQIWTSLDKSGQVWTSLDESGRVWPSLDESGQVWMSLDEFERVCLSLDESGQVWTSLDKSGQVWMSLDEFEQDGTWWNMMEQFWTWLAWSVCFLIALLDNGWRRRRRRRRKTSCRPAGFAAGKKVKKGKSSSQQQTTTLSWQIWNLDNNYVYCVIEEAASNMMMINDSFLNALK